MPCLLSCLLAASVFAQQAITLNGVADLRAAISTDASLTEETRAELLLQLDATQLQLEAQAEFDGQHALLSDIIDTADQQVEQFNQRLATAEAAGEQAAPALPDNASVEEISGQITLLNAERQALSERRAQILQEIDSLPARHIEIQQRLVELQKQTQASPVDTAAQTPEQQIAAALTLARYQAALAEQAALELEVLSEPQRSRVNTAERSWLGYAISRAEEELATLNEALESARASATREQLKATRKLQEQLQSEDPLLQQFASDSRRLARQLREVDTQTDRARAAGATLQQTLEDIQQDSVLMHRRLEVAGRKEVLGRVMITRLDSLPDTGSLRRKIEVRNGLIAETSLRQIDLEEDFRAINERNTYMTALVPDLDDWEEAPRQLVEDLVDQREELLENNLQGLGKLLRQLLENNENAVQLIDASDEFHRFLLGNLLWVRNFTYVDLTTLSHQLGVLLSPQQWTRLPLQLTSGYQQQPWSSALLALLLLSLILRRQLRPIYTRMLTRPILLSAATLWHMLAGLGITAMLVLPWPLMLYCLGALLAAAEPATEFNDALAVALMFTARILYILLFTRLIASRQGVGRRFLKWNSRVLDTLRGELNWAGPTLCLAVLVNIFAYNLDLVASGGPLGALSTAVAAGSIIALSIRLLRCDCFADTTLPRLALRMLLVAGIAVIALQLIGLLFAAEIYLVALGYSVVALGAIKIIGDVLERWLLILRARLERHAREEMKAQEQDAEAEEDEEALVDVLSLSEAHAKLLAMARFLAAAIALYLIWAPSLPALTLLDSITLWQVTDSTNASGALRSITLFDLFLSAVILVVTGLITRHLPSISEVFMREWFNMSAGARYASGILLQYLVIAIGASMFLSTIGWEWGKVQWLVAAMGVGIGFGLQEIVANFISGIIILFERPVRVGDIISVGGAEGTVKKINPRATIIETFDRKEHLIPNKELITGQVINWTLSDAAVRVIIPVGIAYGSDVRRAMALLLEAAGEVATVLPDPEPRASFEDFGDNALVLWLRCYASENRIATWTELRTLINEKFDAAGIVIAFPQRDIHLDTLEPLQLEIRPAPAQTPG